ncbi:MAG: helix-turn-helix domain-containing protein [Eubacterium sp.]|nr:helix-turn-helix domain-containing protein [Eubacterium sp.]
MSKHAISGQSGLSDLLQLFADNVTVSDIIASNVLGNISASIVEKRIQSDMTQQEFANHMCVSQGMVSKWEGGDYNFTIRTLADIAEKLDMDLTVKLVPNKRTVQVKHIQNTDISYIVSEQKKFIGQTLKTNQGKSKIKYIGNRNEGNIYSFCEKMEM